MTPADVETEVRQIAADVFGISRDAVTADSSPDTIEAWDSVKHLELVLALEQHFATTFEPEEIAEMLNVDIVIDTVVERLSG